MTVGAHPTENSAKRKPICKSDSGDKNLRSQLKMGSVLATPPSLASSLTGIDKLNYQYMSTKMGSKWAAAAADHFSHDILLVHKY